MQDASRWIVIGVLLSFCSLAQASDEQSGAKALFFNSLTNEQTLSSPQKGASQGLHVSKTHSLATQKTKTELPAVTGVMYYVELLRPTGELTRVNSDHVFHSGDKIRLHLSSNIDGKLVIYQSEDGSTPQILFPSPKLSEESGQVSKGSDTVLPSSKAWFKFDDHPGQIVLTLKLSAASSQRSDAAALMADAGSVHKLQETQSGSKALVIETDDSPADASRIAVVDSRRDTKIQPGQIALEITLIHRS